jgi:excisionase family DNA binding protein
MITAAEAAKQLGISARMVYDLFHAGRLAGFKIGRAVRFDPADIETFRQSCRSPGTPATSAGGTTSTVTLKAADTDLSAYFRKAGLKPKLTRTTGGKAPGSMPLRLVSNKQTA